MRRTGLDSFWRGREFESLEAMRAPGAALVCPGRRARGLPPDVTALDRRTRRARFEQTLTLEGFDFAANPELPAAAIRDLGSYQCDARV